MQTSPITLAVDTANTGSTTNQSYTRYATYVNRSEYVGPDHELTDRNTLHFYRTAAKPGGNSKGVSRTAVKFTQDVSVANLDGSGNNVMPIIIHCEFSVPVGTPSATMLELRQRLVALLDDDTIMEPLNDTLLI